MKHYHGLLLGCLTIGLIFRFGLFIPKVFNLPMFRVLGRICYSYYLCHILIMRILMAGASQPFEISMANVWSLTAAVFFFGNLLAVPLALIVEFPINAIAKEVLKKMKIQKEKIEMTRNGNVEDLKGKFADKVVVNCI